MAEPVPAIDGSAGEGGGQVLRSSLAMSLVTGRPFVIENIRAGRKKPGLMRQHVTAVFSGFGQLNVRAKEVATRGSTKRSTISPPAFRSARTWPIN